MLRHYIGNLFLATRWYLLMGTVAVLFLLSFFFPVLYDVAIAYCALVLFLTAADYLLLFSGRKTLRVTRELSQRFSLGDDNAIHLTLQSSFPFAIQVIIIEELPTQFQLRNFRMKSKLSANGSGSHTYTLAPTTRGEYGFGNTVSYVSSPLRLLQRRILAGNETTVKVYPSFQQLKKYQLLAMSDNLQFGVKKIRRLGHSMEFEKIKNYVQGDDVRTINWKATARSTELMVNTFTDTRQQQVYCLVDKGRAMKMPFDNMTLLDYSINASLALLNIALLKHDRAGIISFSNKPDEIVAAERKSGQLNIIMEALYRQETDFKESDFEGLWYVLHKRITQRSCLLLFTNFETLAALERQLPYLKKIASRHLLCIVFFQNTLLQQIQIGRAHV